MGYTNQNYDWMGIGQLQKADDGKDDRSRREPPKSVDDHLQNL